MNMPQALQRTAVSFVSVSCKRQFAAVDETDIALDSIKVRGQKLSALSGCLADF
jgi:hypothetical protein